MTVRETVHAKITHGLLKRSVDGKDRKDAS